MTNIAFIGLGNMGAPMAANLLRAGHSLKVFDLSPAAVAEAVAVGAIATASAPDAASDADVVITMLPNGATVRAIYEGQGGLFDILPPGRLLIAAEK
ncbi:MAG TPA: NAD(P)-binding domain-containing protein [Sphingobium sp.]|uniref:NAD(P)-binding domain-containing protein n=1 Tax=Sphingobium sp. TaxID=1912891 RepID=UPI002ED359CA